MAKRPSLSNVMDKGAERTDAPQPAPALLEGQTPRGQRKPGKKRLGWVQLNMYVPEELRTKAKVKALQSERDLSEVVTELLEKWIDS